LAELYYANLNKELAPIFRGRTEEMLENFSMLISVLDGKGLSTDSGTKGQRGYRGKLIFNWIGATTPLPPEVHRLMSNLGTRMVFYEVPAIFPDEDELTAYLQEDNASHALELCHEAGTKLVLEFFQNYPVGSVDRRLIKIHSDYDREIARLAIFTARVRAAIKCEKDGTGNWTPLSAQQPEAPHRVANTLKELVLGAALIEERDQVSDIDIELAAQIATSCIPGHLRPVVKHLIQHGSVDTPTCAGLCRPFVTYGKDSDATFARKPKESSRKVGLRASDARDPRDVEITQREVSQKTARRHMAELDLLGVGKLKKGNSNEPDALLLSPEFRWLQDYAKVVAPAVIARNPEQEGIRNTLSVPCEGF
jgi:hypothetical protein